MEKHADSPFLHPEVIDVPYEDAPLGRVGALAEIAGRDSVGAAVALARGGFLRRILPTIAYTGTEFGDVGSLFANVEWLRRQMEPLGVEVMQAVVIGSPRWWRATIGRVNSLLSRRYGPWHICVGCHMYLHAARLPLAWKSGTTSIVAGERLVHGGAVKINQTRAAVEAYKRVLGDWGMELEMPLFEIDDEEMIAALTGNWGEGRRQPVCVFSGNYRDLGGTPLYEEERLRAYLDEYLVPATRRILASLMDCGEADYEAIVREVLS